MTRGFDAWGHHPLASDLRPGREWRFYAQNAVGSPLRNVAQPLFLPGQGDCTMAVLFSHLFWDKKIRIAILTFATFLALC